MKTEPVHSKIQILSSSGERFDGIAAVNIWTPKQAFWRGFKKSAKIVGILFLCILPFALLEPFLFMLWGSVSIGGLLLLVGPILHLKYWNESKSFEYVTGICPYCHHNGKLFPYLDTAFKSQFTVICKSCGQTHQIVQIE